MAELAIVLHVNDRKPATPGPLQQACDALNGPLEGVLGLGAALVLQDVALHVDEEERGVGPGHAPPTLRHCLPERVGEEEVLRLGVVKVR